MDWTKHPPQPPGLSLLERGVLIALEEIYLAHGGLPPSKKQVMRACGAMSRQEVAAVEVVLNQFFVLEGNSWARTEWDALVIQNAEIREKRSAAANARWAAAMSKSNANASANACAHAMQPEIQRRGEEKDKKEKTSSSLKQEEVKEGLQGLLGQFLCVTGWNEEDEARAGRLIERFGLEVMRRAAAAVEREEGRKPFLSRLEARLLGVGERPAAGHEGFAGKDYMMGGSYVQNLRDL